MTEDFTAVNTESPAVTEGVPAEAPTALQADVPASSPEAPAQTETPFNQHPRWRQMEQKLSDYEHKAKAYDDMMNLSQNLNEQLQANPNSPYYQPPTPEQELQRLVDSRLDVRFQAQESQRLQQDYLGNLNNISAQHKLTPDQKQSFMDFAISNEISNPQAAWKAFDYDNAVLRGQQLSLNAQHNNDAAHIGNSKTTAKAPVSNPMPRNEQERKALMERIFEETG